MDIGEGASPIADPRRLTFDLPALGPGAHLAGLEFGDPARPFDLVFLHANGFNAMTYRDVLAPLAGRLHILALDQQGHGRSPQRTPIEGRQSWADMRLDLEVLLDQLDGPPVVLAGHSLGGAVSLFVAAERPDRVQALALFDPVIPSAAMLAQLLEVESPTTRGNVLAEGALRRRAVFPSRATAIDSYRGRGPFKTWPDAALRGYVEDGFVDRPDGQVELACAPAWESSNFSAHKHDSWAFVAALKVPTTILRAAMGSTCSLTSEDQLPAAVPRRHVETIADSTHFLPIERPELTRATLLAACKPPL